MQEQQETSTQIEEENDFMEDHEMKTQLDTCRIMIEDLQKELVLKSMIVAHIQSEKQKAVQSATTLPKMNLPNHS